MQPLKFEVTRPSKLEEQRGLGCLWLAMHTEPLTPLPSSPCEIFASVLLVYSFLDEESSTDCSVSPLSLYQCFSARPHTAALTIRLLSFASWLGTAASTAGSGVKHLRLQKPPSPVASLSSGVNLTSSEPLSPAAPSDRPFGAWLGAFRSDSFAQVQRISL